MCVHKVEVKVDGVLQEFACGMTFTCSRTNKFKSPQHAQNDNATRGTAFSNTQAVDHRSRFHGQQSVKRKQIDKAQMLALSIGGLPTNAEADVDPEKAATRSNAFDVMKRFVDEGTAQRAVSRGENQRVCLVRWFVFSRQKLTHNIFTCEDHKKVLKAGDANYAAFYPHNVNNWVVKSFVSWLVMIAFTLNELDDFHYGNPFWQALHDGVTVSHVKFQSYGIQFCWGGTNWLLCLGFSHLLGGKAPDIAKGLRKLMKRIDRVRLKQSAAGFGRPTGHSTEDLMNSCIQDYAAMAVARLFQQLLEGCEMHNEDKVLGFGMSIPGVARVIDQPYKVAYELMRAIEKAGGHYTYDSRANELKECRTAAGIRSTK